MGRKYPKNNKSMPAKDRRSNGLDDTHAVPPAEEGRPEPVDPQPSTSGQTQAFFFLPAANSQLNILEKTLLVTGSTSTVTNTSESSTESPTRLTPLSAEHNQQRKTFVDIFSSLSDSDSSDPSHNATINIERPSSAEKNNRSRRKASTPRRHTIGGPAPGPVTPTRQAAKALAEIKLMRATNGLLIPKLPFARLIREVLMQHNGKGMRITVQCLVCLQEAAEIYAVQVIEDAYRCTQHRDRVTLTPKDMQLALMLRNDSVVPF